MQASTIVIGTRGSPLARAQANDVAHRLAAAHGGGLSCEIRIIETSGDRIQDRPLSEVGGKGLFTKEIETALLDRSIDIAVHSAKDMATRLPPGLAIVAVLEREDVRDAFLSVKYGNLAELPRGATVGTSSLRRQAQVRRLRPDLTVVGFRGNVDTRLNKLTAGVADATFLAAAGLNRLGLAQRARALVAVEDMLPAVAQGAVAIEAREDDARSRALVAPLVHRPTALCIAAERAFLGRLDGSCRTPIAGLARLEGGRLRMRGQLIAPDGSEIFEHAAEAAPEAGEQLGLGIAEALIAAAGPDFMARHFGGAGNRLGGSDTSGAA